MFDKLNGICPFCQVEMVILEGQVEAPNKATFDHIIPLYISRKHDKTNLQVICSRCNNKKDRQIIFSI